MECSGSPRRRSTASGEGYRNKQKGRVAAHRRETATADRAIAKSQPGRRHDNLSHPPDPTAPAGIPCRDLTKIHAQARRQRRRRQGPHRLRTQIRNQTRRGIGLTARLDRLRHDNPGRTWPGRGADRAPVHRPRHHQGFVLLALQIERGVARRHARTLAI